MKGEEGGGGGGEKIKIGVCASVYVCMRAWVFV